LQQPAQSSRGLLRFSRNACGEVDMLEGTPILDIKPYMSSIPAEKLRRGWLAEAESAFVDPSRGSHSE
jgi:tRNA (Thr-GGU) A37 N-methylase